MDYTGLKKLLIALSLTGVLPARHRCLLELLCNFCGKTQLCTTSHWELIFYSIAKQIITVSGFLVFFSVRIAFPIPRFNFAPVM